MRGLGFLALTLLLATGGAVVPFVLASRGIPDVELRTRPLHARPGTRVGSMSQPTSQGFRARWDGLERIDVAFARMGEGPVEIELRLLEPESGREVRRARASAAATAPFAWAGFRFEPIADSGGRRYRFELSPVGEAGVVAALAPWVRPRRMPGVRAGRGGVPHEAAVFEGELMAYWDDLSAVALDALEIAAGAATFELVPLDRETRARGEPIRVVESTLEAGSGGMALFTFEPVVESRWQHYRWRATLPPGSQLLVWPVPGEDGAPVFSPTASQLHGPARADDRRLVAATGVGWGRGEADLVFRATSGAGPAPALRLLEQLGGRLFLALALWIAAVGACLGAVARLRAAPGPA